MRKNGVVTLFSLDSKEERFEKIGVYPAWIHSKQRLRDTREVTYPRDSFDVRIDLSEVAEIRVGDMIFFGELEKNEFSVSRCHRVSIVTRNDFGSNPHWHLQAEYEYR